MAENTATGPLQQLSNLSELHIVRQLVLLAGVAASIALGVAVVLWSQGSEYKALYYGLSAEDSGRISTALEQSGQQYRIDPRSGDITVPESELRSTRMLLSQQGLPQQSSREGFEFLDQKQDFNTSKQFEQARLNRALQQELEKTIESLNGILGSRVHLSIPRRTSFLRSSVQPSASVKLALASGITLSDMQIAGIRHLVAAAVVGLDSEGVSVVDQNGILLSGDNDRSLENSSRQMGITRVLERDYAERIVDLLTPIVGEGRVLADVTAELDFSEEESTEEDYDTEPVIRSEQTSREETTEEFAAGGTPGLLEDDLNANAGEEAPATLKEKTSSTRNYEVDHKIIHKRHSTGGIERLSVGVVIDYPKPAAVVAEPVAEGVEGAEANAAATTGLEQQKAETAEKLARLEKLVKDAIGFDEERGDTLTLLNEDFFQVPEEFLPLEEPGILENPLFWKALRFGGAGLVVLFIIFGVLRPVLKSSVAMTNNLPGRRPAGLAYADGAVPEGYEAGYGGEDQVTLTGGNPGNRLAAPSMAGRYQSNLEQVRSIIEAEPDRAARVIQGWVADD